MMTKYANGRSGIRVGVSEKWMTEPSGRAHEKTLTEVRDDMRVKRAMQRAVGRDVAPQYLVDSIRNLIRG